MKSRIFQLSIFILLASALQISGFPGERRLSIRQRVLQAEDGTDVEHEVESGSSAPEELTQAPRDTQRKSILSHRLSNQGKIETETVTEVSASPIQGEPSLADERDFKPAEDSVSKAEEGSFRHSAEDSVFKAEEGSFRQASEESLITGQEERLIQGEGELVHSPGKSLDQEQVEPGNGQNESNISVQVAPSILSQGESLTPGQIGTTNPDQVDTTTSDQVVAPAPAQVDSTALAQLNSTVPPQLESSTPEQEETSTPAQVDSSTTGEHKQASQRTRDLSITDRREALTQKHRELVNPRRRELASSKRQDAAAEE